MKLLSPIVLVSCLAALSPLPASAAPPLKICMLSGSEEYESDKSLSSFKSYLEEHYSTSCTLLKAKGVGSLPGLEALDGADVALFFTRRLEISGVDLDRVKKWCEAGKPIVAVRTASHGFQKWLEFDKLFLGGSYSGHHGAGATLAAQVPPAAKDHPVLAGVGTLRTLASLYKTAPLAGDAQVLLSGSTQTAGPEPVAWVRSPGAPGAPRGRIFYTSLGAQQDFENGSFRRLLVNALFWVAGREVESRGFADPKPRAKPQGTIKLPLRSRVEIFKGSGQWQEVTVTKEIPVAETAILICDLWDKHWCKGASDRCDAIAAKMAPVIKAAREKGVQIIHAPSDTLDFYADWPQRRRMSAVPRVEPPKPLALTDPPLPIDDSDGGCDTEEKPWYLAWTHQNPRVDVGELDGISDSGAEIYSFLAKEGITHLIVAGVHTNMCVLGRSFGIRQMTRWGIRCVLVRDFTDTMYDPKDRPFVPHDEGTSLVVEHIEKYWCPSVLSAEIVQGLPSG